MTKLQERDGHRWAVSDIEPADTVIAAEALRSLPERDFDRYDNPFEAKWTLREKFYLPGALASLLHHLEMSVRRRAEELFGVKLLIDETRHYAGLFKYDPGDRLSVHVDAGIHPVLGKRKHVTAVLYLSDAEDGDLELWRGVPVSSYGLDRSQHTPVTKCIETLKPEFGQLVLFENNDYAWHGMAPYTGDAPRLVVTVSYLSNALDAFENKRQRAYFIPRPNEQWDEEMFRLRDLRADSSRFGEAYVATSKG